MCEAAGIDKPKLEGLPVKDKWKPKQRKYFFCASGQILESVTHQFVLEGCERSTEALCKIASDRTIRANRISAWLDSEGSGEQEFPHKTKHLNGIYQDGNEAWCYGIAPDYNPDMIYMLKEDAIKLCKVLRDGSFELY